MLPMHSCVGRTAARKLDSIAEGTIGVRSAGFGGVPARVSTPETAATENMGARVRGALLPLPVTLHAEVSSLQGTELRHRRGQVGAKSAVAARRLGGAGARPWQVTCCSCTYSHTTHEPPAPRDKHTLARQPKHTPARTLRTTCLTQRETGSRGQADEAHLTPFSDPVCLHPFPGRDVLPWLPPPQARLQLGLPRLS